MTAVDVKSAQWFGKANTYLLYDIYIYTLLQFCMNENEACFPVNLELSCGTGGSTACECTCVMFKASSIFRTLLGIAGPKRILCKIPIPLFVSVLACFFELLGITALTIFHTSLGSRSASELVESVGY